MVIVKYYSACALNCPDLCAFIVHVEEGRIIRLEGDPNHPYTLGRCCPKGYAHVLRMYSEDRLLFPIRKQRDGSFKRISWNEACQEIAEEIISARKRYGPQSIAIYSGSGNDGMAPRYASRFANTLGCRMIPGIVEICFEGAYEGARFNVGPFPPHELSDWANSRCIVIWGTNKHESSIHTKRIIQQAIDNGAKLIVIDPRRTPYARMADIYTTIRPGTDGALALGIASEIVKRGLYNREYVKKHVIGFDAFRERVSQYDKKRVSELTWVSEEIIEKIAKTFATRGPALISTGPAGMNHYTNGTWAARAVHSLLAICGYLGVSGGGFQYLSSDNSPFNGNAVSLNDHLPNDIKPIVPSGTYLPEHILSHTENPIKVLIIQAGNPITQWPNSDKTKEAFDKIPFKVCIDLELTDTARLCDIVLPASFIFEHDNLVHSELHRIVQFAPKIVEPQGEARNELEIWRDIAQRIGLGEYFSLTERDAIILALNSKDCESITIGRLEQHPEGLRTRSAGIPFADFRFKTTTGKIELYSKELESLGLDPLPFHEEPAESPVATPNLYNEYPLVMITGRLGTRLHSQYTAVEVGATVKSFSFCTSCQKCVNECPDEAIQLVRPSSKQIQQDVKDSKDGKARLRHELGSLIEGLAVELSDDQLSIPYEMTALLVPQWDVTKCIGCRECQIDVCPYDVVTDPIRMPSRGTSTQKRAFLRMHWKTALDLGFEDGDRVSIESLRGRVDNIYLELTADIDPRVVWSSDGWWEDSGNINHLTDDRHTAFGHTPGFNSVLVRVIPCIE
ncbi:hypothetical protein EU527_13100 [Candidatus Thorarchaeota archaeon]|nr:MAG: hypothetical protein EU527_13100 [Candidatus Thorarchaeota archaeon]